MLTSMSFPTPAASRSERRVRVLVAYGTRYGQTAKIATRIAGLLKHAGCEVTLGEASDLGGWPRLDGFDGAIVGASVIAGRHQRAVRRFVVRHREALDGMPSAFFSVSGSAGNADPSVQRVGHEQAERFLIETHWHPWATATFGGALSYTRYSPLVRWMVRRMAARDGGPVDTTRDHELTDWDAVSRFASTFAASILPATPAAPARAAAARQLAPVAG